MTSDHPRKPDSAGKLYEMIDQVQNSSDAAALAGVLWPMIAAAQGESGRGDLSEKLSALREEYRHAMNSAADKAQQFAQTEEMDRVSEFSTESERKREAFSALNRAIVIVFAAEDQPASPPTGSGWRSPETAPKDGTSFLAWCPVILGMGDNDATPDGDQRVVWWEQRGQFTSDRDLGNEVFTHWQPLPSDPCQEATEKKL